MRNQSSNPLRNKELRKPFIYHYFLLQLLTLLFIRNKISSNSDGYYSSIPSEKREEYIANHALEYTLYFISQIYEMTFLINDFFIQEPKSCEGSICKILF